MRLEIEVLLDEPDIGRIVRIGNWEFEVDYETNEGSWEWRGSAKSEQYQESNRTSHHARGRAKERVAEAKGVPETPESGVSRRPKMPRMPSRARVFKPNVWKVFEP
jgi:hypothetical protein